MLDSDYPPEQTIPLAFLCSLVMALCPLAEDWKEAFGTFEMQAVELELVIRIASL